MLEWILGFVFFILGSVIGAFGLVQSLIVMRVGLPTTSILHRAGLIRDAGLLRRNYFMSLLIILGLTGGISMLIFQYVQEYQAIAYGIGIALMFLRGIGRSGASTDNYNEFLERNARYLCDEERCRALLTRYLQ